MFDMERWRLRIVYFFLLLALVYEKFQLSASLNAEGSALLRFRERIEVDPYGALSNWEEGALDPCSWAGVECSDDGKVVALNLKDLGLKGTLALELGKLIHLRTLNLHNNLFYGVIPREIGNLQKLEVLDLGYNNLSGTLPSDLKRILSLEFLLLRGNRFSGVMPPELQVLNTRSGIIVDEDLADRKSTARSLGDDTRRRLLADRRDNPPADGAGTNPTRSPSPSPNGPPPLSPSFPAPPQPKPDTPASSGDTQRPSGKSFAIVYIIIGSVGAVCFLVALTAIYFLCLRGDKGDVVMPWATGLSGQLQKAFVTGVPSLRRLELQAACEDFSNIIGTLSDCTLYKGTLSNGVEIAVTSTLATSAAEWSDQSEAQFREKISVLSKVNHKNFMNLLGYCKEEEPFTRMMVFEYAPNGTLFEHLHIKEAEQLDWPARLRIVMGVIYCLEHVHQLNPPVIIRNLNSSSIYLSEDYAAHISDIGYGTEAKEATGDSESPDQESIVYKFGILLLEIISGRLPFSEDDGLLVLWASSYLTGKRPLNNMVDPTLKSVPEEDIAALCEVVRSCIKPNPKERPTVVEIASQMKNITSMPPERVTPRASPLWWAELEIISTEG
ncbi:inactive receptor-like serine/threonine-protein kinase At2g40270 [Typha angustifolia]|uniref:inactive receptor-like serine/threonine-protein kinase At2g40270 n=1 Tax=Typha angustifolia TaxID=59011 RepID=UPI003C2C9131